MHVFFHVYDHACGGLKLPLGVFLDYSLLLSLMQNLNPGLTHKPVLSGCLHRPSIGITYCCYDHLACDGLWESKLILRLARQTLYPLSQLPGSQAPQFSPCGCWLWE